MTYEKVLVALDINSDYEVVLQRALNLAESSDAIHLIYVVEPLYFPETYVVGAILEIQEKGRQHAKRVFSELQQEHRILPGNCHIEVGNPARLIHEVAKAGTMDAIVVGSHGKHGVKLLLGSTANAVLHGASCDVLAVRVFDDE